MHTRWFQEFHSQKVNAHFEFNQDYNIYFAGYGPKNTMAVREYPPEGGVHPLELIGFAQLEFTFGDAKYRDTEEVWDLEGNKYEVTVDIDPLTNKRVLFLDENTLQPRGTFNNAYEEGETPDLGLPDGIVKVGQYFYSILNGKPTIPLKAPIHEGMVYVIYEKPYCFQELEPDNELNPFPGSLWSLRPISFPPLYPLAVATYSDSYWDTWLFPIPFPYKTFSNDDEVVDNNGYIMLERQPQLQYSREDYRLADTFPMAHSIQTPMTRGIVRTTPIGKKPLIAKLRRHYRMHIEAKSA